MTGIARPIADYTVLSALGTAFEDKGPTMWRDLQPHVNRYWELNQQYIKELPPLPFPRWWEDSEGGEFHLSEWVAAQVSKAAPAARTASLTPFRRKHGPLKS